MHCALVFTELSIVFVPYVLKCHSQGRSFIRNVNAVHLHLVEVIRCSLDTKISQIISIVSTVFRVLEKGNFFTKQSN